MDANKIGGRSEARRDGESQKIEGFKVLFELVRNTSKKRKKKKGNPEPIFCLREKKKRKRKKSQPLTHLYIPNLQK